jgi:AbrB family looped-hinge helix DNA binding protein
LRERETSVSQKGQVTIPREIRSRLGIKPGDRVRFELEGDRAFISPAPSKLLKWYGVVEPRQRPEDFRKLREEFEQGVAEESAAEG